MFTSTGQGLLGNNMFAYCLNNPVRYVDVTGRLAHDALENGNQVEEIKPDDDGGLSCWSNLILEIEAKLQSLADNAKATISGSGHVNGTYVHSQFKHLVDAYNHPNLRTEASYYNGDPAYYGKPGSIRADVVLVDSTTGKPLYAWDLKTGNAYLSSSRIAFMQHHMGTDIPIKVIR